jgi:type IV secretion system protein VirD4
MISQDHLAKLARQKPWVINTTFAGFYIILAIFLPAVLMMRIGMESMVVYIPVAAFIGLRVNGVRRQVAQIIGEQNLKQGIHGNAYWETGQNLVNAGMQWAEGMPPLKGVVLDVNMSFNDQGHLLTVGGARSGKGNLIMFNMLTNTYDGSKIIIDPKGEICAVTSAYQQGLGRKVVAIDPWNIQEQIGADHIIKPSGFNPLQFLDPENENLPDDCDMIAEMLVPLDNKKEDHWSRSARQWISAYLLHMITTFPEEQRTLTRLRGLFRLPWDSTNDADDTLSKFLIDMKLNDSQFSETIKQNANEIISMWKGDDREAKSINSTAVAATDLFKSMPMQRALDKSSFDARDITKGNTTIYICIPVERLETHGVFLRLLIGSFITAVQRYRDKKVLMILDEFYSLGYMSKIVKGMAQMPGYNLQLWPIVQDLNQLRDIYGETSWETFIANSAVRLFMGISDNFTAEYVSKQLGNYTAGNYNPETGEIIRSDARPLLNPEEVRHFKPIIGFTKKTKPICLSQVEYWKVEPLKTYALRNPYHS